MRRSILQAVQEGDWDFEPVSCDFKNYEPTTAMPGSAEKMHVLQERIRRGLPLWHPADRRYFDESARAFA